MMQTKWEYKIFRIRHDFNTLEEDLRCLGQLGWEMTGSGTTGTNFDTSEVLLLFFKRKISESNILPINPCANSLHQGNNKNEPDVDKIVEELVDACNDHQKAGSVDDTGEFPVINLKKY